MVINVVSRIAAVLPGSPRQVVSGVDHTKTLLHFRCDWTGGSRRYKDVAEPFGRKAEPGGAKELGIFDNYTPESSHGT